MDHLEGRGTVVRLLVGSQGQVDVEHRELVLLRPILLDVFLSEESLDNVEGVLDLALQWDEVDHGPDESLDGGLCHILQGVLHYIFCLLKEFLEFAALVLLLGGHIQTIPRSLKLAPGLELLRVLPEIGRDDALDFVDPDLSHVVRDLGCRRLLHELELLDAHGPRDIRVVDVLPQGVVALLPYLLQGPDRRVFVEDRAQAEL